MLKSNSAPSPIPFLDLRRIHESLIDEFTGAFQDIVKRSAFTNGAEVVAFEQAFAAWVGVDHCVGFSSGLDALAIGLKCLGHRPGDRVILPAMTFIATAEAITANSGIPVLVDVDPQGLLDLNQVEHQLRQGVRFILPVHLFGQSVDMVPLRKLADAYGAKILEDACQAHGAAGTAKHGHAAAYSFYPGKNLGALGDGGALCTHDAELAKMAKALREHGQTRKYYHEYEGWTARLDTIQAAFLQIKLRYLTRWNAERIEAAKYYGTALKSTNRLQSEVYDGRHVYHLYVILAENREALAEEFKIQQIGYGFHYPSTLSQVPCYRDRPWAGGEYPNASRFAAEGVSLPIFPGITRAEQDVVIEAVRKVTSRSAPRSG